MEAMGARIKRLRLAKGLSQDGLARRVGMSRQHVFQVERGDIRHLRGDTLVRYAQALGVSERYLESGYEPGPTGDEWPPLEVCLRHTSQLTEDQIAQVARIVRALEAEQRLAQLLAQEHNAASVAPLVGGSVRQD